METKNPIPGIPAPGVPSPEYGRALPSDIVAAMHGQMFQKEPSATELIAKKSPYLKTLFLLLGMN
jgi:hypothetical protein